ncbi:uncharacterized protein [Montipora foliosa]|uniref:uncharacterized protein n=1 Tax=Montipora foliosa TaxID=591990 RepID=UPI0035F1AE2C
MFSWISWKTILVPIVLASVYDIIATRYFPGGGSRIVWILRHGKQLSVKLQKASHSLADAICNQPEECKKTADEFFAFVHGLPKDVWETVESILSNVTSSPPKTQESHDNEMAEKQRRAILNVAKYNKSDVSHKGNATKAEEVISSLRFESYEENNLCDLKEGIPDNEFDATVEEVAILTNMPEKLKRVIKRARNFTGNVLAVNRLQFRTQDGNMVFGRVAVLRNGDKLDMAYSLHSVEYDLKRKQRKPENAENLKKFSESLNNDDNNDKEDKSLNDGNDNDEEDDDDSAKISVHLREDFLAFFHKQAIDGFVKHCDYLLKTLDNDKKKEPEILQHMGVNNVETGEQDHDKVGAE